MSDVTAGRRDRLGASGAGDAGLDGFALKFVAMVSMLIDHVGYVVFEYAMFYQGGTAAFQELLAAPWGWLFRGGEVGLRMIGRIAFPLYCFLLVEGFWHTRSRGRYLGRLILFALISEIPFDLAVSNCLWNPGFQNVFFDLAVSFGVLCGLEWAKAMWLRRGVGELWQVYLLQGLIAAAGSGLAWLLRADYGAAGVVFAVAFYCERNDRGRQAAAAGTIGFLESIGHTMGAGALAAVPIWLYNGRKGQSGNKYFFYWFYPVHLAALFLVRWLGLGVAVGA